jgi:membrane-associated phospholipid phosphatase
MARRCVPRLSYDVLFVTPGSEQSQDRSTHVTIVRRWLVAIAAVASLLFAALYGVAVWTRAGQRLDSTALRGRQLLSPHDMRVAQALHTRIDIASVSLLGGAILLVAILRGRRRLAAGIAVIIAGSFVSAELMKRLLGRPHLTATDSLKHAATFPSGHTTIAMALAVGALFVAPQRVRGLVAILGAAFAAAIGCSMVITASHRPSDVIGAVLLVTTWSAAVAAVLLRAQPPAARARPLWARLNPWLLLAGATLLSAAFLSTVVVALAIHRGHLDTVELGRAFIGAASAILGTVITCIAALTFALHDIDLDKPVGANSSPARVESIPESLEARR